MSHKLANYREWVQIRRFINFFKLGPPKVSCDQPKHAKDIDIEAKAIP